MQVKPRRGASPATRLSIPDNAVMTFPNSDWFVWWTITVDGDTNMGDGLQYLFRTAEYQVAGGLIVMFNGNTGSNAATRLRFQAYINGSGTVKCLSPAAMEIGKSYIGGLMRKDGVVYSVLCPILTAEPTDGSAVLFGSGSSGTQALTVALDTPGLTYFFGRNATDRQYDQSTGRFGIVHRAPVALEIARLAAGHEITETEVPKLYLRLNGLQDFKDYGEASLPVTVQGTFTETAEPPYVYAAPVAQPVAPIINGKPSIVAPTTTGGPWTYIPASVSGTPVPTRTQQWSVDGSDVANATEASFSLSTTNVDQILRVRQIETNGTGSPATSTSDPVTISAITANPSGLVLIPPIAESFYQRQGGSAVVPYNGSWSGPTKPARIERQLYSSKTGAVVHTWTDLNATINDDGTFTSSPSIPVTTDGGYKYRTAVRMLNGAGAILFTTEIYDSRFAVGDIIPFGGSSSPTAWTGSGSGCSRTPDHDRISTIGGTADAPTWALWGNCGAALTMANEWSARTGVPVCTFSVAESGVQLTDWVNTNSSTWTNAAKKIAFAGNKLGGFVMSAGSNDVGTNGVVTSRNQHAGKIRTFCSNLRALTGQSATQLPIYWGGINRRFGTDIAANYARMAENDVDRDESVNLLLVQSLDYEIKADNVHMSDAATRSYCDNRLNPVFGQAMQGIRLRGPAIIEMRKRSDGAADVKVAHRGSTALVANSTITGFRAYDSANAELPGVTASITSSDTMRVSASGSIARLTYLEGASPDVGTPVYGNTSPILPLATESFMTMVEASSPEVPTPTPDTTAPTFAAGSAISITGITNNGATASWPTATDNTGVTGYEYSINGGNNYTNVALVRTISLTGLPASTQVSVMVRAYDAAGYRSMPLQTTFTTLAATPTPGPQPSTPTFMRSKSRTIIIKAKPGSFSQEGEFWTLSGAKKPLGTIDPNATIDITFNWTDVLADIQDSITNVQFDIIGLTNKGGYRDGAFATIFVSNATGAPSITCRITTASTPPRIEDRTVYLTVEQQ